MDNSVLDPEMPYRGPPVCEIPQGLTGSAKLDAVLQDDGLDAVSGVLVVITIIAILIPLLVPAAKSVREAA